MDIFSAVIGFGILIYSVILHEIAHGLVAAKLGDPTAQRAGRLTLNPLPHIDPIMTILVPALLFFTSGFLLGRSIIIGAAKPVPINPLYFNDPRRDTALVSIAGIITNFGLAGVGAVLFHLLGPSAPLLATIFQFMVYINILLAVFNIIPIAPLDGSKVLASILPTDMAQVLLSLDRYGFIIILALLYFGVLSAVMLPVIQILMNFLQVPAF